MSAGNCISKVSRDRWGSLSQCSRKAFKDGYCKQHHPAAKKAKALAWNSKWEAERTARKQKLAAEAEAARKARAYDALMAELADDEDMISVMFVQEFLTGTK